MRASCAGKIVLNDLVPGSAKQYWTLERQQSGRYAIRPKACPGTYLFLGPRCDQQLARVVPTSRVYMLNPPCQYSVTQGDTLEALAPVFSTTVSALLALNPGVDPAALYPGQQLATCTLAPCQHSIVGEWQGHGCALHGTRWVLCMQTKLHEEFGACVGCTG